MGCSRLPAQTSPVWIGTMHDGPDPFSRAGAPLAAGMPPLYEAALRVVARDALLLREGVL